MRTIDLNKIKFLCIVEVPVGGHCITADDPYDTTQQQCGVGMNCINGVCVCNLRVTEQEDEGLLCGWSDYNIIASTCFVTLC